MWAILLPLPVGSQKQVTGRGRIEKQREHFFSLYSAPGTVLVGADLCIILYNPFHRIPEAGGCLPHLVDKEARLGENRFA